MGLFAGSFQSAQYSGVCKQCHEAVPSRNTERRQEERRRYAVTRGKEYLTAEQFAERNAARRVPENVRRISQPAEVQFERAFRRAVLEIRRTHVPAILWSIVQQRVSRRRYDRTAYREWYKKKGDAIRAAYRRKYRSNPTAERARVRNYKHANPHAVAKWGDRRRRRAAAADDGTLAKDRVKRLFATTKRCHYCGERFTHANPATLDHATPLSRGGRHSIFNAVICCRKCNSSKRDRTYNEFVAGQLALIGHLGSCERPHTTGNAPGRCSSIHQQLRYPCRVF